MNLVQITNGLCCRGTRDGFGGKDFHSKCDGHSNTLTFVKAFGSEFIFGGFTSVSWESPRDRKYKSDLNAFIFSLTNKDNKPVEMNIDPERDQYAIHCHSSYGPAFGNGHDLSLANSDYTPMESYSWLGCTYKHPQYEFEADKAGTFLAGSHKFQLGEIEVYQRELTKKH